MHLGELLRRAARSDGTRPAVALGGKAVLDYGGLARRAAAIAGALRQRYGLQPGDRVAIAAGNCVQYPEVLYGIWWAGLAAVPMNAKLHAREFAFMLADSDASLCFCDEKIAGSLGGETAGLSGLREVVTLGSPSYQRLLDSDGIAVQPTTPDDLAWLFYTSGTTGRPKGAQLTHRNLFAMTACYFADVDTVAPGDAIIHAAPMSHGSGLYSVPHVAQSALQVIPESGGFEPAEVFELWQSHANCAFFFAPTMVKRLVEDPRAGSVDPGGFKTCIYGGGPMYVADLRRAIEVFGNRFVQIYGQGESPMTITALSRSQHAQRDHPRWSDRLASVGRAQLLVEVRVAGEGGNAPAPDGTTGEVLVRGPSVMAGYWRNPEATAAALVDGWLHTGDVGAMDEDGFLTLKDRSKDVIISGGTNIYPREVEEVLLRHSGVLECSVVGNAHPEWGEEVVAFIVARRDARPDEAELDRLCLSEIARFKRPRRYVFVNELPKNNYGKILKTELRARLAKGA